MKTLVALTVCGLLSPVVFAADQGAAQGKYLEEVAKHWKNLRDLTLAVADAMPAEDYSFKPNAEEMSFGEQIAHIGLANANYFSSIAGTKSPFSKPAAYDKTVVTKLAADSFDYCAKILADLKDSDPDRMAGSVTVRERLLGAFVHTAHHRGQAEVYLRVKNIKPPAYKF